MSDFECNNYYIISIIVITKLNISPYENVKVYCHFSVFKISCKNHYDRKKIKLSLFDAGES